MESKVYVYKLYNNSTKFKQFGSVWKTEKKKVIKDYHEEFKAALYGNAKSNYCILQH